MHVYLVRHGEAAAAQVDSARPLTLEGRRQCEAVAAFLKRNGARASAIWHSPKVRARETAEILRDSALGGGLIEHRGLLPEDHPSEAALAIDAETDDLCIVGHLPHMSYLASALLVGPNAAPFALFDTASTLCIERTGPSRWHLQWFISPEQL
jgi:phosphohistidine phosphatase